MSVKPSKKFTTISSSNSNNQIKGTGNGGYSRNDLNQKKSNTAQAVVTKKLK